MRLNVPFLTFKRTIIFLIISFIALLFFTQTIFKHQQIQDHLTEQLSAACGSTCQVDEFKWHWFPLPAITAEKFHTESEVFLIDVPLVKLYPNWPSLFTKNASLGRIKFIKPVFTLRAIKLKGSETPHRSLPNIKVVIKNGTFNLPQIELNSALASKKLTLDGVNAKFTIKNQHIKFNAKVKSRFTGRISAIGRLDLSKHYYRVDLDSKDLNLTKLFKSPKNTPWNPPDTNLSLKFHLEGMGLNNFKLKVTDQNSAFSSQLGGQSLLITKFDGLELTRHDQEFFLGIKNLTLTDPALTISGKISRRIVPSSSSPHWIIDLSARDIDLVTVRQHILDLWGNHHVAKTVCNIVLGGKVSSARYVFNGRTQDFRDLTKMKIWADAVNVPIYLEHIDLDIDQASGPITIINGYLEGQNLKADIGTSHGNNGDLLLDLTHRSTAFKFDLDLNVDLAELQEVLGQIVDRQNFQQELTNFSTVAGRASGHLNVVKKHGKVLTTVDIDKIKATGFYERLPWPFTISKAKLQVYPDQVTWQTNQAQLGPHKIKSSKGSVTWKSDILLNISQFDADIDLAALLDEGYLQTDHGIFYVNDYCKHILTDISGVAKLTKSHFSGPVLAPEKWRFQTSVNARDLNLKIPSFPKAIKSQALQAELSSERASFSGIFDLFQQSIYISGNYRHHLFEKWGGDLIINGRIESELGHWLIEKDFVKPKYLPRLPFKVENFQVTTSNSSFNNYRLRGEIFATQAKKSASLKLDINKRSNDDIKILTFIDGSKQGRLSITSRLKPKKKELLTWRGTLQAQTLGTIFPHNIIKSGVLNGVFSRLIADTGPDDTTYSGYLEAHDIRWQRGEESKPLLIRSLKVSGEDNLIHIKKIEASIDEDHLVAKGSFSSASNGHLLNMKVVADTLSLANLTTALTDHFSQADYYTDGTESKNNTPMLPDNLSGKIHFNVATFNYSPVPVGDQRQAPTKDLVHDEDTDNQRTYHWNDLKGIASIDSGNLAVDISSSKLCGITNSGQVFTGINAANSIFKLTTTEPLYFEDVLPCLNVQQSLLEGPFTLEGSLLGNPDHWRKGKLTLNSDEGIIKRLNLLSKIFSVVNFTDLFTWRNLPDIDNKGLMYNKLQLVSHVEENKLIFDSAVLKGKGVNITGRGKINLEGDLDSKLTFFIAPFKIIDNVVTNVPIIGKALGGKKESILTFPVSVKGPLKDPEVSALAPSDVGRATVELLMDTLSLPFRIFIPAKKEEKIKEQDVR